MPERNFPTETWTEDDWFEGLSPMQRYLFWYLWSNGHCKQSGLYYLPIRVMAAETKLLEMELAELIKTLSPKVAWYPEKNLVWVRNFIKRNSKSTTFLEAVATQLKSIKEQDIVRTLVEYNYKTHNISIPYQGGNNTPPIPTDYLSSTSTITNTSSKDTSMGDKIKQVFAGLKTRRNYDSRSPQAEGKAIKDMLQEGFTPDDILKAWDIIKQRPFYQDKGLSMMSVKKDIHEVLKGGTHKKDITASIGKPLSKK